MKYNKPLINSSTSFNINSCPVPLHLYPISTFPPSTTMLCLARLLLQDNPDISIILFINMPVYLFIISLLGLFKRYSFL